MKIAEVDIRIVPDLNGAGDGHWMQRWVDKMANAQIIEQKNVKSPLKDDWIAAIHNDVMMATRPVVLVGHGLGANAIVHAAAEFVDTKVKGAFLVAPLDLEENKKAPAKALPFANTPRDPLPFPSLLIGSDNDRYCSPERALEFSNCWGSEYHSAGEAGHIDIKSGHGPWPEGMMMFTRIMQRI